MQSYNNKIQSTLEMKLMILICQKIITKLYTLLVSSDGYGSFFSNPTKGLNTTKAS